jgi:hypothetical protein
MRFEHVMNVRLSVGTSQPFGQSAYGRRIIVPITGGVFAGPGLRGRVLPGGSDWQIVRADGTTAVDAHFDIETDDGSRLGVASRGLYLAERPCYYRTAVRITAPPGRYAWLNTAQFVSQVKSSFNWVSQRFYRVV